MDNPGGGGADIIIISSRSEKRKLIWGLNLSEALTPVYKNVYVYLLECSLFNIKMFFIYLFIGLNKLNNTYSYALNILVYLFVIINNIVCTKQPINDI